MMLPTVDRVLLHQLAIKAIPADTPTGRSDLGNFSMETSQILLGCVKLTVKVSQERPFDAPPHQWYRHHLFTSASVGGVCCA